MSDLATQLREGPTPETAELQRLLHQRYVNDGDTVARKALWALQDLERQRNVAVGLLRELTEPAEVQEQTRIFNDALAFLQLLRGTP